MSERRHLTAIAVFVSAVSTTAHPEDGHGFTFDPEADLALGSLLDPVGLTSVSPQGTDDPGGAATTATIDAGGGWEVEVGIYLFLPAVNATATVNGISTKMNVSFGDIWDTFDVFALSGRVEAWHQDRWGLFFDGLWVDLGLDGNVSGTDIGVNVDIAQGLFDIGAGCRVFDAPLGQDTSWRWALDGLGGMRVQYLRQEIKIGPAPTLGTSKDWAEILVGGRLRFTYDDRLSLLVRADASGFGIGSGSDLTWTINALAQWRFADRWTLIGGYRWFNIDYSSGSGMDEFGMNGQMDGLVLAIAYTF